MPIYKTCDLKKNIRSLIEQKNITQQKLAEEIGMTQSNLSKALNEKEKREFTVAQLCSISTYFGVSIDSLLNQEKNQNIDFGNARNLAAVIAELIISINAKFFPIRVKEHAQKFCAAENSFDEYDKEIDYLALYFPDFWDWRDYEGICKNDLEYQQLRSEYYSCGNGTRWKSFNCFLKELNVLLPLYRSNELSEEDFRNSLKALLNTVSDRNLF